MNNPAINVNSEIGKLKSVLLKRPGAEVENITPDTMERLLFDDIPFLEIAQQEHDFFANTLRENGVETLYIDDLAVEALDTDEKVREAFVQQYLDEAGYGIGTTHDALNDYLKTFNTRDLVTKLYAGFVVMNLILKMIHYTIWLVVMRQIHSCWIHCQTPTSHVTHKHQLEMV